MNQQISKVLYLEQVILLLVFIGFIFACNNLGVCPLLWQLVLTFLLCLFLALFFLPFSLFSQYKNKIFFIPAFFTLVELLRSIIFTGFPWLSLGYTQVPHSPLIGYLPIIGIHGVSFLVVLSAILIFHIFRKNTKKIYLIIFLFFIWGFGQYLKSIEWSKAKGETISTTLIQGNISQDKKWNKNMINESLRSLSKTNTW